MGRLLTGKGTKEVSDEKEGVALTRVLNMPVKKHISALKKQVERIDGAVAKLDKVCAGLDTGKDERAGVRQGKAVTDESDIGTAEERTGETKNQESGSKFIRFYGKSR